MTDLIFYMKQLKLFFYGLKLFLMEILDYKKNNPKNPPIKAVPKAEAPRVNIAKSLK